MNENLLFCHFLQEKDGAKAQFGYFLYSPAFSLVTSGKTNDPNVILDLLENNTPVLYDLVYQYVDILECYRQSERPIPYQKKYLDLYAIYRYRRHLHFYVDILECLSRLSPREAENLGNVEYEALDAKDFARIVRQIYEGLSLHPTENPSLGIGWFDLNQAKHIATELDHYDEGKRNALLELRENPKKKFLFFDIECANTDFAEGKICEFSYCLFDASMNLLEKKEILINPGEGEENDFKLLGRSDSRDLHLQYEENDYEAYRKAPSFLEVEEEISSLLLDEDTYLLGYEVESDLRFLSYTFSRYSLPVPCLVGIDVKRVYEEVLERKMRSLGDLVERFVPQEESSTLRFHSALDDSYATGLVLKYFLLFKGISFEALLQQVDEDVIRLNEFAFFPIPDLAEEATYARLESDHLL